MISCMIVDDEQHAIELLSKHIDKIATLDLKFATTSSVKAFEYLQQNRIDLIFLDIQMPELNGMQLLKLIKGRSKAILTTAYSDYALEGYDHDVIDYLLKPIVFERFLKAAQKAIDMLAVNPNAGSPYPTQHDDGFIFVKSDGRNKITRILLKDIEYVQGLRNYIAIYTTTGKVITLLTMKEIEGQLPNNQFIRVHNSYIIPVNKIAEIQGNQVCIGKHKLPIGEVYKKTFLNLIEKHAIRNKK